MDKKEINSEIKKTLIKKFEALLKAKNDKKIQLAKIIDNYATNIVKKEIFFSLDEKIQDILSACLDLHHWANESLPPTYTEKDIRKIVAKLRESS